MVPRFLGWGGMGIVDADGTILIQLGTWVSIMVISFPGGMWLSGV